MEALLDFNAIVIAGLNKIATLDLTKAYDKINRTLLWEECKRVMGTSILKIIPACLQEIMVEWKGNVTRKRATLRLSLTQGPPLSSVLFLIYINDMTEFCPRPVSFEAQEDTLGGAEVTLMADDVVLHAKGWGELQRWLDACSRWACKKNMKWESSKCAVICESEEEIENDKLKLYIMGGGISKVKAATYLGMTLTSKGLTPRKNLERVDATIQRAGSLSTVTG